MIIEIYSYLIPHPSLCLVIPEEAPQKLALGQEMVKLLVTINDSYSISLAVNEVNRIDVFEDDFNDAILRQSRYRSTLTVTGNLPGVYVYSVINRAMSAPRTASFTIEGIIFTIDYCGINIIMVRAGASGLTNKYS